MTLPLGHVEESCRWSLGSFDFLASVHKSLRIRYLWKELAFDSLRNS